VVDIQAEWLYGIIAGINLSAGTDLKVIFDGDFLRVERSRGPAEGPGGVIVGHPAHRSSLRGFRTLLKWIREDVLPYSGASPGVPPFL
jgi:hypothetical protein